MIFRFKPICPRPLLLATLCALLPAASCVAQDREMLGDAAQVQPFVTRIDKGKAATTGQSPAFWTVNAYDAETVGEVRGGPDPLTQTLSFGIVNLEGKPSMMLQMQRPLKLDAKRRYQLTLDYLTAGTNGGFVKFPGSELKQLNLPDSGKRWKPLQFAFDGGEARGFRLEFHNQGRGENTGLYLKNIRLDVIGAATNVAAKPATAPPTTLRNATGWYGTLARELGEQGVPDGEFLLGADEAATFARLRPYGAQIDRARVRDLTRAEVPAELPFTTAKQIEIVRPTSNPWDTNLGFTLEQPVRAGESGLLVAYIRSGGSREANTVSLQIEAKSDERDFASLRGGRVSPSPEWKRYLFPIEFKKSADTWKLEFFAGGPTQVIEIGGIALINFGDKAKAADLPRTQFDYNYAGREADAPWRAAAAERIDRLRKGDLTVRVVDANGRAVPDANVNIVMTRHAFRFGTEVHTPFFAQPFDAKTRKQHSASDVEKYKKFVLDNFNTTTVGTFKWEPWRGAWAKEFGPGNTLQALAWADENGMWVHAHAPIWHQFGVMPFKQGQTAPAEIKSGIVRWLDEVLGAPTVREKVDSWDAINHPFVFGEVWRDYGKRLNLPDEGLELHLDELAHYRKLAPDAQLWVNEGNIMVRGGNQFDKYVAYLDYLTRHDAPLYGAGFMCHFGVNDLTAPEELLRRLDKLSEQGRRNGHPLKLQVTEFDVTADAADAEQVKTQADYTRDFYTLMFSHPDVEAIIAWGFWAGEMWLPRAAWLDKDWNLRPNGAAVTNLIKRDWWTNAQGTSDAAGLYKTRGFKGDYQITVTRAGQSATATASVGDTPGVVTVVLK